MAIDDNTTTRSPLPTVILATPGQGIARAERQPDDNWLVTRLADDHKVYCLAAAPDGQTLYAGSDRGALRSTDAGRSWQAMQAAALVISVTFSRMVRPGKKWLSMNSVASGGGRNGRPAIFRARKTPRGIGELLS